MYFHSIFILFHPKRFRQISFKSCTYNFCRKERKDNILEKLTKNLNIAHFENIHKINN